jgi:hypothetical protein
MRREARLTQDERGGLRRSLFCTCQRIGRAGRFVILHNQVPVQVHHEYAR